MIRYSKYDKDTRTDKVWYESSTVYFSKFIENENDNWNYDNILSLQHIFHHFYIGLCYNNSNNNFKHIYDNICDTDCNICHKPRSVTHTYDNACDTTCNVEGCGFTRVANHIFDNDCDATCNVTDCEYTREVEHKFSDTWSSSENSHWKECACGAKTELAEHKYTVRKHTTEEHWRECVCGNQRGRRA